MPKSPSPVKKSAKSNNPVAEALLDVLADTYALYAKTQNHHWNVEGPQFRSLHLMFEEQYTALAAEVDEIAERVRGLDVKVPGVFTLYDTRASIEQAQKELAAMDMVQDLLDGHEQLIDTMQKAKEAAANHEDDETEDMMVAAITAHQKTAWMLRSVTR